MSYQSATATLRERTRAAVQTFRAGRRHPRRPVEVIVSPESMVQFGRGNADLPPAAVVRQVLKALDFDEDRLFDFRFDHKLAHYLAVREFTELPMPHSAGLAEFSRNAHDSRQLETLLEREFPAGYIIKPSLGAGSGDDDSFDVAARIVTMFPRLPDVTRDDIDPYLVQERLHIDQEYRVHTVEDRVIEELTLARHNAKPIDTLTRTRVVDFASKCLASMPDALVHDAVCGWDIAETCGELVVIEINYTGFHPKWNRGFQTSGFLQEPPEGTGHLGTWLRWMREAYDVQVAFAASRSKWDDPEWARELARLVVA